jgi:NAD(P)-dependent dehydrogenase (short-subunit alcohol dehydrogenase family)
VDFEGRVVVVTGSGRGIGRGHALLFGARGARVVVADSGAELDGTGASAEPADEVVAEIEAAGGTAVACYADVTREDGASSIVATAIERFGRIDAVVNNAGRNSRIPFGEMPLDEYRRMLDLHFFGSLCTIRAAWPHFVEAGYGRVVNTVSEALFAGHDMTHYAAAKGAVFGLTRTLATEGEAHGILVNAVAPRGITRSSVANVFATAPAEVLEEARRRSAPEMNSPTMVYLAHHSCTATGELFQTGGRSVRRFAVVRSRPLRLSTLDPEEVAEGFDQLFDLTDVSVVDHHLPG